VVFDPEGVRQIREVARTLDTSQEEVRRKARDVVRLSTFQVERRAKRRAPVDTGALRNSINSSFSGDGLGTAFVGECGPEVHYGGFVELGTVKMAPKPYLGPAFDAVEPGFIEAMEQIDPLTGR
jgi:phage protein, HK97 gp10 family